MKTRPRPLHRLSLALLALGLANLTPLPAQPAATGVIEGRVLNTTAGDYLANVRVTVDGTALEAYTNAGGEFRITGVPAGSANVRVSYGGVTRQNASVPVGAGQVATRNFEIAALETKPAKAAGEVVTMQEFTVAERELSAQAAAIQEQHAAPNIKNVVAFQEFGDLGDGNPGEFLKFVLVSRSR